MDERVFQTVNRLRKAGNLDEAWDVGCKAIHENPDDQYLRGAFFWVCYDYLKEVQNSIKGRAATRNGDHTPNESELDRIDFLLTWILWLNIPAGGYEYRSLLLTFQANLECIPKLLLLLFRMVDGLFLDEDKQPYVNEKGESPSLMLKFARKVAKAWMQYDEVRELSIDELCAFFAKTRAQTGDTQHKIWLDYDEAKCLIKAKRYEQARESVLVVLRKKQTESWAWGALAATYRQEDPEAAVILFSKALSCAQDDTFALPTLKSFAQLLARQGHVKEASMCVKRTVNCYTDNGWNIKSDVEKLLTAPWYDPDAEPELLKPFLDHRAERALDYLFGEREQRLAIVQNVHQSGKGFHVYLNRNESVSVRLGVFRAKTPPSPGDYVSLTVSKQDGSVIEAKPTEAAEMDDVGYLEGALRVTERGFGFVEDTFVPPFLIKADMDGRAVGVVRIIDYDKTKKKYSWKALAIRNVGELC